jgi:hypothetical protein
MITAISPLHHYCCNASVSAKTAGQYLEIAVDDGRLLSAEVVQASRDLEREIDYLLRRERFA